MPTISRLMSCLYLSNGVALSPRTDFSEGLNCYATKSSFTQATKALADSVQAVVLLVEHDSTQYLPEGSLFRILTNLCGSPPSQQAKRVTFPCMFRFSAIFPAQKEAIEISPMSAPNDYYAFSLSSLELNSMQREAMINPPYSYDVTIQSPQMILKRSLLELYKAFPFALSGSVKSTSMF